MSTFASAVSVPWRCLVPPTWKEEYLIQWLREDVPSFDVGGLIVGTTSAVASLYCKTNGAVLAGSPFVTDIFTHLGCEIEWRFEEGAVIELTSSKVAIAEVRGPANKILQGERISLNLLSRLSGIASDARHMKTSLTAAGHTTRVAGTRKTTPGFRIFEKYALIVGGADPHRQDLSSAVMLKDNHIDAVGGDIARAVQMAKLVAGFTVKVEVECRSVQDALTSCAAGADVVMLDNFDAPKAKTAAELIKSQYPSVMIEISGGISNETELLSYASEHVDIISMGALTHSHSTIDYSLKIVR